MQVLCAAMRNLSAPIGLIVNPRSGNDVRRVIASAGSSTLEDKISIVRRVARGASAFGAITIITNREPHRIAGRALDTLAGVTLHYVDDPIDNTEADSTRAAAAMERAGCAVVIVLGGDGTNRAVIKGWPDAVLIPLSTGTNNAFPYWCEPTVAGMAAALMASGAVGAAGATKRAKLVRIEHGDEHDVALVDAVAVDDPFVGSLELFDPATMRVALLTRADPAAIGFAAVGGLLSPLSADDDAALLVHFAPPESAPQVLVAPTAPGHLAPVGIRSVERIELDELLFVTGPTILAFDGERKRRVLDGDMAKLSVRRDGPQVVDVGRVMHTAAIEGFLRRVESPTVR